MILPRYHIAPSRIPGAGKGLFLDETVARGSLITAPDDIRKVYKWSDVQALPDAAALLASNSQPTDTDIDTAMAGNICRCGTYIRIREAIKQAAQLSATSAAPGG